MAYVYRHIRKDTNQPFYIGVGLTNDNHARAKAKAKRNSYWKNIVSKSEYDIQILFDDVSREFALEKERELIAIYKRVEDGGTLCNMTLGGEGTLGKAPVNVKKVYALSKDGKIFSFDTTKQAAIETGCVNISHNIKNKSKSLLGWFFSYTLDGLNDLPRQSMAGHHQNHKKNKVTLTNGIDIVTFDSYTSAGKHIGVYPNHIGDLVRGKLKFAKGWTLVNCKIEIP
jgi:hypothetical protein